MADDKIRRRLRYFRARDWFMVELTMQLPVTLGPNDVLVFYRDLSLRATETVTFKTKEDVLEFVRPHVLLKYMGVEP